MARLFISHSSTDNLEAIAFHDWLVSEGWSDADVFIDLHDLGAGERWKEALARANERCEAVVLLASPDSLASTECRLEIRMAEDYGKEIIVAILYLLKTDSAELGPYRERQIVNLAEEPRDATFTVTHNGQTKAVTFSRQTLRHIKARLDKLGISPGSFTWNPASLDTASPYPGFGGFGETEAALFFGRAGDIARGMGELRRLRRLGTGQVIVLQAASGAGKSSYLKAGLWPRLQRDAEFLPLAIVRPAGGILTGEQGLGRGLAASLSRHRNLRTAGEIHEALCGDIAHADSAFVGLINEATAFAHAVQAVARPDAPMPTPIIAVDQAEELFAAADADESNRFLTLLSRLIDPERATRYPDCPRLAAPPILIWTLRADSLDAMLHATEAAGLAPPQPFLLPPIPRDAYREIIEAPLAIASQAGMRAAIDPLLVDALVEASTGADALPLLAFTLRQLFAENRSGTSANLTLARFNAAGGMTGVLRKRLDAALRESRIDDAGFRRLIIPHLATWDEEAHPPAAKRLLADEEELLSGDRADLKPLTDALVEGRLLTRSGREAGVGTPGRSLEVAHEALLRVSPLSDWLAEDREFLIWRDRLGKARAAYEANVRGMLVGRELQIARDWTARRTDPGDIAEAVRAFIAASIAEDDRRRDEEEQRERRHQEAAIKEAEARERAAAAETHAARMREEAAALEARAAKEREAASIELLAASRRVARRTTAGLAAALMLAVAAGGFGWYAQEQKHKADAQSERATAAFAEAERKAVEANAQAARAEELRRRAESEAEKVRDTADVARMLFEQASDRDEKLMSVDGAVRAKKELTLEERHRALFNELLGRATRGSTAAQTLVGSMYAIGQGTPKDYGKAREWYQKAAVAGGAEAMLQIGVLYSNGRGVVQDYAKAREWYEKAAAEGAAVAMNNIGWFYANGYGVVQDHAKAREWYEKAAAEGAAVAMINIGWLYANGQGVTQDYTKSLEWFEKAAVAGDASAMSYIGWHYNTGKGVSQDYAKAREWFEKAATAGDATAMFNIGLLYENGNGVSQDYAKAREWYVWAAAAGDADAMRSIGLLYDNGQGVSKDYAKAREWYEKAVAAGNASAMRSIGLLYEYGQGVSKDYGKAREWYEKAAAAGNADAMRSIGLLYDYGQGVSQDYGKAREWYEKAAAAGNADAMHSIGLLYEYGKGVSQDYAKAREWYEKAAAAGSAAAMRNIGLLYEYGRGVSKDYAKAREWYEKAAAAGDATALRNIGVLYASGQGVTQDYAKAREWYGKAATAGDASAMRNIGQFYANGQGVTQDYAKAREWYEKAAAAGSAAAMRNIGLLYEYGRGVSKDYAKAREWYEKAAAAGDASAMRNIGQFYANGQGVTQDYAKAREWYEKAAAAGDAVAMRNIGLLYDNGQGVTQDYAKAREWFEKAAAAGDAMRNIGQLYANGQGVAQDYAKAREWYEKAAAAGDAQAMVDIGQLYAKGQGVTPDYAKAREWYEKAATAGDIWGMISIGALYADGNGVTKDFANARDWFQKAAATGDAVAKHVLTEFFIFEAGANGNHAEALRLKEALTAEVELQETKTAGTPGQQTASQLSHVAWRALLAREPDKALAASERSLALRPGELTAESNRAHALMVLGRAEEARAVYRAHKDEPLVGSKNKLWQQLIAEEFANLRKAGISHPLMAEIEAALEVRP